MGKIGKIVFFSILLYCSFIYDCYAYTFRTPMNDIVTTKATLYLVDKKGNIITNKFNGEISFSYNFVDWTQYSLQINEDFGYYKGLMLIMKTNFNVENNNKKATLQYFFHIPEQELVRIFTLAQSFNKDTYIKIKIPVVEKYKIIDNEGTKHYTYFYKIYVDKEHFVLEWNDYYNEGHNEGHKERFLFNKEVLFYIHQMLIQ